MEAVTRGSQAVGWSIAIGPKTLSLVWYGRLCVCSGMVRIEGAGGVQIESEGEKRQLYIPKYRGFFIQIRPRLENFFYF